MYKFLCILLQTFCVLASVAPSFLLSNEPTEDPIAPQESSKPSIIVLYGPPGSGRAKIAVKLHQNFDIPRISFAELLADTLHEDSVIGTQSREYMNNGGDIPIDLFWMILDRRMKMKDCHRGCLWEGIPCTIEQAKLSKSKLSDRFRFIIFSIDATNDWLIQRVEGRVFCSSCGRVYNDQQSSPKICGACDICGHPLQRRAEDSPEMVQARFQTYQESISSTLAFWNEQKILQNISGDQPLEQIYSEILQITQKNL